MACRSSQASAATARSTTCPKTAPYLACVTSSTAFRLTSGSWRRRSSRPSPPCPPSSSSLRHTRGRPPVPAALLRRRHLFIYIFVFTPQAGSEGGADPPVPDVPPRPSAPLDRRGGLAAQDASRGGAPEDERRDVHAPPRAHRQGAQAAGGPGPGPIPICFQAVVLTPPPSSGRPQLAEAPRGRAEKRGTTVAQRGQKGPEPAGGGLLR